jgi:hypothetical protein
MHSLLYIGNYTKDTIISPAGAKYVDGGAVNYVAHATAETGMKVAIVTHHAKEDDRVGMARSNAPAKMWVLLDSYEVACFEPNLP